jgi:hypothetical protein
MRDPNRLAAYKRVECHIVLYPYSRKITSDDIHFYPYEEYVNDVLSNQRSAYAEIQSPADQVFGLALGLCIALIYALLSPASLLNIEAIVSVFGAYLVGKELWNDIERLLVNVSKTWKLRYQDGYYQYRLEKDTTLTLYSYLAKRQRYGKAALLPDRIDFIKQSNSQTLRMCFDSGYRAAAHRWHGQTAPDASQPASAHVHSIHVDRDLMDDLIEDGFMFGVKLSLGRRFLGFTHSIELFQSLQVGGRDDKTPDRRLVGGAIAPARAALGSLDQTGQWHEGAVFYRNTVDFGRLKLYLNSGLVSGQSILHLQRGD